MNGNDARHIDLSAIVDASYENKWIAISPDYSAVVASSISLADLMKSIAEKDVIIHRVLPNNVSFVPLLA